MGGNTAAILPAFAKLREGTWAQDVARSPPLAAATAAC